jgi:hypothetical protein
MSCAGPSANEVEQMLQKNIPIGTSKEEVVAFLDKEGISHSAGYQDGSYYAKSKQITASMKKGGWLLSSTGIFIKLYFDADDKLTKIAVDETVTGL